MEERTRNRGAEATKFNADKHALAVMPDMKAALAAGNKGLAAMAAYLTAHGVPTPQGGPWRTEAVRRTRRRLVDLGYPEFKVKPRQSVKLSELSPEARARHNALMREWGLA